MKKIFKNKIINSSMLLALMIGVLFVPLKTQANPDVSITPASGGTAISIDTTSFTGGTHAETALGSIIIQEGAVGDIATGVHTLTIPEGWNFTDAYVTIAVGGATDLTVGNVSINSTNGTTLSFNVTSPSSAGVATLTFSGIKVHPTGSNPLPSGNITMTQGVIAGVDGSTNFGTLTAIPGAVTKLAITTQPAHTVYGSAISTVVVNTQDQFGNNSINGLGVTENVTMVLASGTGVLSGGGALNIGTGGANGQVSFTSLEVSDVGEKTLEAQNATYTNATSDAFNITQKALTATVTVVAKTYDGNETATIDVRTPVGLEGGDTVTLLGGTALFNNKNVGTDKAVTATGLTMEASGNYLKYTFNGNATGTGDITRKEVVLNRVFPDSKVYDGTTVSDKTPTFSGLIAGDIGVGTQIFSSKNVAADIQLNVSVTSIRDDDGSGNDVTGNYDITLNHGMGGVITQRPITITAQTATKEYDGGTTSAVLPLITDGTLATGDVAVFAQTYNDATKTVDTDKIVSIDSAGLTGADAGNYTLSLEGAPTVLADITAKAVTIGGTFTANNKVYDGGVTASVLSNSLTVTGKEASDTVTIVPVLTFANKNVADEKTVSIVEGTALAGADAGNYTLSLEGAPTVLADITVLNTAGSFTVDATKVYDGTTDATVLTRVVNGKIGEDDITLTGGTATYDNENVGTGKIVTLAGASLAGAEVGNYNLTGVNTTTANITTRPITVTAATDTKVYDDNTTSSGVPTITSGSLAGGDDITTIIQTFDTKNVGLGKTLTAAGPVNDGFGGANYDVSFVTATGNITADVLDHFVVTVSNSTPNIGTPLSLTVTAVDQYGHTINAANGVTPYTGVAFISTNATAPYTLPQSYAFLSADTGTKTFTNGVIFNSVQSGVIITARDNNDADILGSATGINVSDNSDVVNPVISAVSSSTAQTTASVSFESNETGQGRLAYATGSNTPITTDWIALTANNQATINLGNLICGTTYNYTIYAKDGSGNEATENSSFTTTACDVNDVTAPVISATSTSVTKVSAGVTFTSSESGLAKVAYSYGSLTPLATDYVAVTAATPKTINLGNLICGTTYNYTIYAKDGSGNEATENSSFTTTACDTVLLGVTNNRLVKRYATKDGDPNNGWHWILDVTVPNDQTTLSMKFSNLTGAGTINANNIHFYSEQASNFDASTNMASITNADTWSTDTLSLDSDIDGNSSNGRQIQIKIRAGVPSDSVNGAYSASYDIQAEEI